MAVAKLISGLMRPESGEIRWQGEEIHSLAEDYSRSVTYIGHRTAVKEELSSLENLRISSGLSGIEITTAAAATALERLGLAGRENLPARFLSEGQRRRSALARLITCHTTLWLLDEVLASLDHAAGILIESIIGEHLNKGGIAIVATHQELRISPGSFQRLELATGVPSEAASLGWSS
jgi:heme exporter protein A